MTSLESIRTATIDGPSSRAAVQPGDQTPVLGDVVGGRRPALLRSASTSPVLASNTTRRSRQARDCPGSRRRPPRRLHRHRPDSAVRTRIAPHSSHGTTSSGRRVLDVADGGAVQSPSGTRRSAAPATVPAPMPRCLRTRSYRPSRSAGKPWTSSRPIRGPPRLGHVRVLPVPCPGAAARRPAPPRRLQFDPGVRQVVSTASRRSINSSRSSSSVAWRRVSVASSCSRSATWRWATLPLSSSALSFSSRARTARSRSPGGRVPVQVAERGLHRDQFVPLARGRRSRPR